MSPNPSSWTWTATLYLSVNFLPRSVTIFVREPSTQIVSVPSFERTGLMVGVGVGLAATAVVAVAVGAAAVGVADGAAAGVLQALTMSAAAAAVMNFLRLVMCDSSPV